MKYEIFDENNKKILTMEANSIEEVKVTLALMKSQSRKCKIK